jgi:hypothetical protein
MKIFRLLGERLDEELVNSSDVVNPSWSLTKMEVRHGGEFADKAIFIPNPPTGYEWQLGKDYDNSRILFLKKNG